MAQDIGRGNPLAKGQTHRIAEQALTRAGFAGDYRKARLKPDAERRRDSDIFQFNANQTHGSILA